MSNSEIWKAIPGYDGYYEASNLGRIRSVDRTVPINTRRGSYFRRLHGNIVKQVFDGRGAYLQVMLSKNGDHRKQLVHRLVATTFIDNPNGLSEVNHKDEDKTNNAASNLEWCDHKYNNNYGSKIGMTRGEKNPQNKFSEETIREIRKLFIPGDPEFGAMGLSKRFGISPSHMTSILKRRRWGWFE